jgi:dihydroorotate dehydrogenase
VPRNSLTTPGTDQLITVGGIETVDDAWNRITAGAFLLQGYTGFVYAGGLWAKHIHDGIAHRLHQNGFTTLSDAVGSATQQAPEQN